MPPRITHMPASTTFPPASSTCWHHLHIIQRYPRAIWITHMPPSITHMLALPTYYLASPTWQHHPHVIQHHPRVIQHHPHTGIAHISSSIIHMLASSSITHMPSGVISHFARMCTLRTGQGKASETLSGVACLPPQGHALLHGRRQCPTRPSLTIPAMEEAVSAVAVTQGLGRAASEPRPARLSPQ
ncbi:hypothetical protein P7K49_032368 [Saguinus oedipus]|uniref:Uncharacterized protein n=1 Tax=Saguinus oedipus TaxID=9490 RepID=A0ABQ9TY16_SAGOE|nr:hypothetical protein P7K49_032368 [Saguinus oedipus]